MTTISTEILRLIKTNNKTRHLYRDRGDVGLIYGASEIVTSSALGLVCSGEIMAAKHTARDETEIRNAAVCTYKVGQK